MDLTSTLGQHPVAALPLLFIAGVGTSLTPCIYPMIPITAGILAGTSKPGAPRRSAISRTLAYAVGLALVYASLGLLAGMTGTLFGTISSNKWAYLAFGVILLVASLAMFDVIPVRIPARLGTWAAERTAESLGGAFVMGAASGLVAAPCGAPAFAAVLSWVAATHSAVWGFVSLFVFSLGLTAILVAVGFVSGSVAALPRSGAWMLAAKRIGATLILVMAEYYFVRAGMYW